MPTPKQEKLIEKISENLRNQGETKTKGEMLLEVGYTESISKSPSQIFDSKGVKEGISDIVQELEKKRQIALKHLTDEKIGKERAKDITDIVDKLTKNIQLLSGGATENVKFTPIYGGQALSGHDSNTKDIQVEKKDTSSGGGDFGEQDD